MATPSEPLILLPILTTLTILLILIFTIAMIRSSNHYYHSRKIQKAQQQRADLEAACAFVLTNEETPLLARMECSYGAAERRGREEVKKKVREERERIRELVWRCLVVRSAMGL
ncbi:hypothetical protein B0J14DRAFT_564993 [Halenospora varia]|nr:hypothetical protein B0J14DRAFT_564993 [Halenospora varia]